jgi:hypothetical protein
MLWFCRQNRAGAEPRGVVALTGFLGVDIFILKYFAKQIHLCSLHISKLRLIHDLYFQCWAQILCKTTSFIKPEK